MDKQEASNLPEQSADKTFEEFMKKPTTLPVDLTITLTNFLDEQDAHRCAEVVRGYLQVFGRLMDLSLLDWVYVTFDYEGTLASLDVGTGSGTVFKPTNDEIATGVAMAPSVLRDGIWKSVIVINATYARALSYEIRATDNVTQEQLEVLRAETVHILAHECGHVHDHTMQTKHMPPESYSKKWSAFEHRLKEPAMACWGEYIAEFQGAGFGTKDTLDNYEKVFCQRLTAAWPAITAGIRVPFSLKGTRSTEAHTSIQLHYLEGLTSLLTFFCIALNCTKVRSQQAPEQAPKIVTDTETQSPATPAAVEYGSRPIQHGLLAARPRRRTESLC